MKLDLNNMKHKLWFILTPIGLWILFFITTIVRYVKTIPQLDWITFGFILSTVLVTISGSILLRHDQKEIKKLMDDIRNSE